MNTLTNNLKQGLSLSLDDGKFLAFALRSLSLLGLFMVLDRVYGKVTRLPESVYHRESIFFGVPDTKALVFVAGGLLIGAILAWKIPGLRVSWSRLNEGRSLRVFVGLLMAALLWSFAAYPINYHYGQDHFADRGVLALLALLTLWRPIFCLPLVLALWVVISQFHYPLNSFSIVMAEFRPLLQILTLFSAFLLLQAKQGLARVEHFLFVTGCLIASNFWEPGFLKARMDWINHGHLYGMHVGAYAHGWLGTFSPERIAGLAQSMAKMDWPLRLGTLSLELGAILFFVQARVARLLLVLWTVLLSAFMLCFGYFFWKWILTQLAFLWLLRRWAEEPDRQKRLFQRNTVILSLPIIAAAAVTFQSAGLAWYDTPVSYRYHYEVTGASGERYNVPTRAFAPYQDEFTMAHFSYAVPAKTIVSPYGASGDRETANRLTEAKTPGEIAVLEEEFGHVGFSKGLAANLMSLLENWIVAENEVIASADRFEWRQSLPFLWNSREPTVYRRQEAIERLYISRTTFYFDGEKIHELAETPLGVIEAP